MIPSQRQLFDIPDDVAYLNCAYMSPLMRPVVAAGSAGIARKARPWTIAPADFFGESEHARVLFARLIGARADDVAIIPAVSYGIAIAARNLAPGAGQTLVVLAEQFPSNVYPWRELARRAGARIQSVARPVHGDWTQAVIETIDERTAIAALPHCHWTDGACIDLARVGRRCREVGAALVVDLTQSGGAMPFDVTAVQPDFAVCGCYKWLLGPYTLGFVYVAPRHHDGEPLEQGWIARRGSEDFARLVDYQDAYQPGARRYDMGERSAFHLLPMAVQALEHILDWGVDSIAATLAARTATIAERAAGMGLGTLPVQQRAGHFLGLRFPMGVPAGLAARFAENKVYVSVRGDALRITPHLYNTDADVERLFTVLEAALAEN